MSRHQRLLSFVLACASSFIVARAQSQTTPSPEVKKLAVMVGKFAIKDELKAGFMGPNSPAMKFSGTDDCKWAADGFAVICEAALYRPGRNKYSEASLYYYDPTSKTYRYHAVDSSGGIEDKTGTVNGNVWTWLGESVFGGKMFHTRYTMKVVSDGFEYTDESGESETSMKVFVSGKETRIAPATEPNDSLTLPTADSKQQVLDLSREWVTAEIKHDADTLRRILDDKFAASFGVEKPYDKEAFIKLIVTGDVDSTESQTLTDETVVIDQDTAVEVGTDTARGTERGAAYTVVYRYTVTYIRRNGRWLALAEHLVQVPQAK